MGGINYYKHGNLQCVRQKALAKKRHTPKQAQFVSAVHQKKTDWEAVLNAGDEHYYRPGNDGTPHKKYGVNYTVPLYQYHFKFGILNRLYWNWNPYPSKNQYGPSTAFLITIELLDCPSYAKVYFSRAMVSGEVLYVWWSYPWNKKCNQGPGTYPNRWSKRGAGAGPYWLTGPRITGRAEVHFKWRFFSQWGGLGPIQKTIVRKDNWQ